MAKTFFLQSRAAAAFMLIAFITLVSCEESSFVGLEIQPPGDRFYTRSHQDNMLSTSVWARDSVYSTSQSRSLLGVHNDPVFGRMEASFMTQIGVSATIDFGDEPVADSLMLYLVYPSVYQSTGGPMEITVREISETIQYDKDYFSNFDPGTIVYDDELARFTINPAENDTLISIPITSSRFIDKVVNAPDTATRSLGDFLNYIKGVYVTAEPAGGSGSVYSVNLNHLESKMSLYYRNETPDTSYRYDYVINPGANRVNVFSHDYSTAQFYEILNQIENDDSLFYVQGTSGVMGRIAFNQLHHWHDSMPVSINSARLYLPVDINSIEDGKYPLPARLGILERNSEGQLVGLVDQALGDEYFGGSYDADNGYFRVNITNWVQSFVRGKKSDNAIYIIVRDGATIPNRAVFTNSKHSSGGPFVEIRYTNH